MPELQLAFVRTRTPDYVQLVLQREEKAGATAMPWLAPILLHNHAVAEHLVREADGLGGKMPRCYLCVASLALNPCVSRKMTKCRR